MMNEELKSINPNAEIDTIETVESENMESDY